jgi:hypothetical protein
MYDLRAEPEQADEWERRGDSDLDHENGSSDRVGDAGNLRFDIAGKGIRQGLLDARPCLLRRGVGHGVVASDHDVLVGGIPRTVLGARGQGVAHVQSESELQNGDEKRNEYQRDKHEIDNRRTVFGTTPPIGVCAENAS